MRESNFNSPAQNRACVCISQALYDRRAIDAPAPSLPLVNSLTHLSYLTATSPRIREILSIDGGLERLVRILKACAASNSTSAGIEENLAQLKGRGATLGKGARKSPFKAFDEYRPTIDLDLALGGGGGEGPIPRPLALALPSSPSPTSSKSKQLLFTYTLAFQCVVNIGVRGSETIRTRVVEAGALDVVVNVLERYLEESARRKNKAEGERRSSKAVFPAAAEVDNGAPRVQVMLSLPLPLTQPSLARLEATSSTSTTSLSASSSSTSLLAPPARVSTPDTVVSSMDEGEGEGEGDNGSSSGQEQEGDEVVVLPGVVDGVESERRRSENKLQIDRDGDVVMEGVAEEGGPTEEEREMEMETGEAPTRQRSTSRRHHHHHHHHSAPLSQQPTPTPPPPAQPTTAPRTEQGGLQYRDEDVLLSLQLLAYLSKYPHVRSVFHSPSELHDEDDEEEEDCSHSHSHSHSHGKASTFSTSTPPSSSSKSTTTPTLSSNVFSLVESFTHRPSTSDSSSPRHSNEVQYWAGVIMRNACRKDESRGGIRQCANMQCGVWEKYAREFAKCRRCRKAKYCSKGCQSSAWGRGHRYWCAKAAPKEGGAGGAAGEEGGGAGERRRAQEEEEEEEEDGPTSSHHRTANPDSALHTPLDPPLPPTTTITTTRLRGLTPHRANAGIPPLHVPGAGLNVPGGPRINLNLNLDGGFGLGGGAGEEGLDEGMVAREMMGGGVVFGVGVGEEGV